jgi:ribonucleotide monophosphatase NagD (HAD superfamily)
MTEQNGNNQFQSWINSMDTFIFDCDGVLWRGSQLIPGVQETLSKLRSLGKRILFVTNNSTKSRKAYLKKFMSLGLQADVVWVFTGWILCALTARSEADYRSL